MNNLPTVPCELCTQPTTYTGTKRCDRCYELETRIKSDPQLARTILAGCDKALEGLFCQEASIHSRETYIPCGARAAAVVWHARDKRAYLMCAPCAWHNVKNRGGRLLIATDRRDIP